MAESGIIEAGKILGLPPHPPLTVGIAINGKSNSKYVVNWALDKFTPEENVAFKLLHVRPKITSVPTPSKLTSVPTPMGNTIPLTQVREDVAAAYIKEIEWQTSQMLLPFKKMCTHRKVQVDVIMNESDDVVDGIKEAVVKYSIKKLVIGVATRGLFTRKRKGNTLSARISASTPSSCTIYAVSKGKLLSIRPSDEETNQSFRDNSTVITSSVGISSSNSFSTRTDVTSVASFSQFNSPSLLMQRSQALSTINWNDRHARTNSTETNHLGSQSQDLEVQAFSTTKEVLLHTRTTSNEANHSRCQSQDIEEGKDAESACSSTSENGPLFSQSPSWKSFPTDHPSWVSDQADVVSDYSSCDGQADVKFELDKLRIELRHVRGMYAVAQSEAIDASRLLSDLNKRHSEEAKKLEEIKYRENRVEELAREEKERSEAAIKEAEYVRYCAEREASQRREAELKATRDAKEKEKLECTLDCSAQQYQKFTWEEIVSATSSFSEDFKLGMGAYGTVYKCNLHHTTAAVKVLRSKENSNSKQFMQEIEILSKVRHPHLVILLGACPERGCLIYEYMKNGSLEERLLRLNNTPPIPWFERFRIAWEVALALAYLHNAKPKPIIHRDLKPANILLDHNYVSKIGDVGLSTMPQSEASWATTMQAETGPVGTLCYIDPEYQRSGLISPKSDVYAFGMVILQLLTAKPAIALAHTMETAIDEGRLLHILDSDAGNWPHEETKELALLGLGCAELRRRDRPDLEQVLPVLERLKEFACTARDTISSQCTAPSHFICPILKEVMSDPCVAADGYTYDRKAIVKWLEENDKSPMTNLPLPNKNLLPNYTLLSAIMGWKSNNQMTNVS